MKMLVRLKDLKPNPFRDFLVDPVDQEQVETLQKSIEEHEFWGGIAARQEHGEIQVAAGWHRVQAAIAAGVKTAEVFVQPPGRMTDAEMIRIYHVENATHRSDRGSALAGSVASAVKYIARGLLTGTSAGFPPTWEKKTIETMRGQLQTEKGLGRRAVADFLYRIPGATLTTIEQQLANLKSSGIYDRIIGELQTEIAVEAEEAAKEAARAEAERVAAEKAAAKAKAEHEEADAERARQREEARKAKEARDAKVAAEKEAKAKADLIEKQRKAEEKAARDEERRKEEEQREMARAAAAAIRQKQAEKEAAEHAEAAAKAKAEKEAADRAKKAAAEQDRKFREENRDFDFEGVSKHLKEASLIRRFRDLVHADGIRPYVTRADHAPLAEAIVAKFKSDPQVKSHDYLAGYMDLHILSLAVERKRVEQKITREQEAEANRQNAYRQAEKKLAQFHTAARGCKTYLDALLDLAKDAGMKLEDHIDFVTGIGDIKEMIEQARKHGLFKDWTSPPEWSAPPVVRRHALNGNVAKIAAMLDNENEGERHTAADKLHARARKENKSIAQLLGLD